MPKGHYDRAKSKPNRGMYQAGHRVWNEGANMAESGYNDFGHKGQKRPPRTDQHRYHLSESISRREWRPSQEHLEHFRTKVMPQAHTLSVRLKIAATKREQSDVRSQFSERRPLHNGDYRYREWRTQVFSRDDYTCRGCGSRGGVLQADHIKPWSTHPELRYELTNGRTLCVSCHKQTPTYGIKALQSA